MTTDQSGRTMTGSDPEPPPLTLVRDVDGKQWCRVLAGEYWISEQSADPESWTKIAGNYGPVTVLEWGVASDSRSAGDAGVIQVIMTEGIQDPFRAWLDSRGLYLYPIPSEDDRLPSFGIGIVP